MNLPLIITSVLITMIVIGPLMDWLDARAEARDWAEHLRQEANRERIEEARECYRRQCAEGDKR